MYDDFSPSNIIFYTIAALLVLYSLLGVFGFCLNLLWEVLRSCLGSKVQFPQLALYCPQLDDHCRTAGNQYRAMLVYFTVIVIGLYTYIDSTPREVEEWLKEGKFVSQDDITVTQKAFGDVTVLMGLVLFLIYGLTTLYFNMTSLYLGIYKQVFID